VSRRDDLIFVNTSSVKRVQSRAVVTVVAPGGSDCAKRRGSIALAN
jgi:hypothetical protein